MFQNMQKKVLLKHPTHLLQNNYILLPVFLQEFRMVHLIIFSLRYIGYCSALEKAGISINPEYVTNIVQSTEEGYNGVRALLANGCDATAFFCADDITAIGAMKAIKEHGLRIPEDVSVASIDDIDTAQYLTPSLTTTHIPLDEMGQMAAKILIDRIEGGHSKHVKILFPYDIIERNSTAGPKKI